MSGEESGLGHTDILHEAFPRRYVAKR